MTWGHLRSTASVEIISKYPEKHSVTLLKNKDFFCEGVALASLRLVFLPERILVRTLSSFDRILDSKEHEFSYILVLDICFYSHMVMALAYE